MPQDTKIKGIANRKNEHYGSRVLAIDLHLHSDRSDGSDSPQRIAELAASANLSAFALTDHDTVAGLADARRRAEELGLDFMTGIELSVHIADRTIHLLGYAFDETHPEMIETLAAQQRSRATRNELLVQKLVQLGYEIDLAEVLAKSKGGTVGRPHVAAVLMDKGYVDSIDQAFAELLATDRPAYIERRELSACDAIGLIHRCGGVAVWAHPSRGVHIDHPRLEEALHELVPAGLDGMECRYSRFTPAQRRTMTKLASKHGLVATGGSDYHGSYKPDLAIGVGTGDLQIPDNVFEQLRERAQNFL